MAISPAALVHRHYEALINQGDPTAADRDLAAGFVDHAAPPGTPPGPESARRWVATIRDAFPDIVVTEDLVITNGDLVAVAATWRGTHLGAFLGAPPSGQPVTMRGIVIWRIEGDQLAERWAVLDYDALRTQIATGPANTQRQ